MIVIKKYHYVIAVLILVAAVFLAMKSAAGREKNAEPRAAENSVEGDRCDGEDRRSVQGEF